LRFHLNSGRLMSRGEEMNEENSELERGQKAITRAASSKRWLRSRLLIGPWRRTRNTQPTNSIMPSAFVQSRKGFFATVLEALHDSRRRQASREIDRYRHLMSDPGEHNTRRSNKTELAELPATGDAGKQTNAYPEHRFLSTLSAFRTD
jgi:hypothetical protein